MIIEKDSLFIYIPEGYNGPIDAAIYYPGAGGSKSLNSSDGKPYQEYIAGNPNKVVIVNKSGSENTDNIYKALDEVQHTTNMTFRDVNFYSHSAGQAAMVNTASKAANYGYNVKFMTVLDSAYQLENIHISEKEAQALAKNGTTAVFFDQTNWGRENNLGMLTKYKVPILYVQCDANSADWGRRHQIINATPIDNGLIDFYSGDVNALNTTGSNITGYHFYTYDYNNGDWKRINKNEFDASVSTLAMNGRTGMGGQGYITLEKRETTTSAAGGVNAKIYKDELKVFLSSSCLKTVAGDVADAKNLQSAIKKFKENALLKGDMWSAVYAKLDQFDSALSERIALMDELYSVLSSSINELVNLMGDDYDMLDTSELPELNEELITLKSTKASLEASIAKGAYKKNKDDELVRDYAQERAWANDLAKVEETINEIEKLIARLEDLEVKYTEIVEKINEVLAKVNTFNNKVKMITPSPKYAYVVTV